MSLWWDGHPYGGTVTSRAISGAGTVLAEGTGIAGAGTSPAVPGPCSILVSECPSKEELFGSTPTAPAMQPQLSLPFPRRWGLIFPGLHQPWLWWAKGSKPPRLVAPQ